MITVNKESETPIYRQIINAVKKGIIDGVYRPNDILPSVRGIAKSNGINPNTVQKAFRELEKTGAVYSIAGRGNFVADSGDILKESHKKEIKDRFIALVKEAKEAGLWMDDLITLMDAAYY